MLRCVFVTPRSKPHSRLPTDSLSGHVLTSAGFRRGVCADTGTCPSLSSAKGAQRSLGLAVAVHGATSVLQCVLSALATCSKEGGVCAARLVVSA